MLACQQVELLGLAVVVEPQLLARRLDLGQLCAHALVVPVQGQMVVLQRRTRCKKDYILRNRFLERQKLKINVGTLLSLRKGFWNDRHRHNGGMILNGRKRVSYG